MNLFTKTILLVSKTNGMDELMDYNILDNTSLSQLKWLSWRDAEKLTSHISYIGITYSSLFFYHIDIEFFFVPLTIFKEVPTIIMKN